MKNEIAFENRDDAFKTAELLLNNGYVVMLSEEEKLTILNYLDGEYSSHTNTFIADRNAVVFMSRDEYESEMFNSDDDEN